MRRFLLHVSAAIILLSAVWLSYTPTARAASASCTASPDSGAPGTLFTLHVSGFTPNTHLWLYAVEPDGTAFSDILFQDFGGTIKTNEQGAASFAFRSRFDQLGLPIARALGSWTLVAQELGQGGAVVHEAHCAIFIRGAAAPLEGATLTVTPDAGFNDAIYTVHGSGFAPNEIVNLWLTPPMYCSGFAFDLDGFLSVNAAASAIGWGSAKTNSAGEFAYDIFGNTPYFCAGDWSVSARSPGSGVAGAAVFRVVGHPIEVGGATLTAYPTSAISRGGVIQFQGSGFDANEVVICWYTRPEGTVREFPVHYADSSGGLDLVLATGFDDEILGMHYSEGSLGNYVMTCKGQASGDIATAEFLLYGGITDP